MKEQFKIASRIEDLTTPLESAMDALNFWALHFDESVNDILMEDDDRMIAWACRSHAAGCLSVFQLITGELNESVSKLSKLSEQLYAEAEKGNTGERENEPERD